MLDYKVVSLVENKLGEVQDQRERESLYRALLFKCLDRRYYYDRERNQIKGC